MPDLATLLDDLAASRRLVSSALVRLAASGPTTQAEEWTPRDIAAHLAASESECFEPRIRAIARGEQPRFDFYSNDGRDFSALELGSALKEWDTTRSRLHDFVRSLSSAELANLGYHGDYGELTIPAYLRLALDHDREHLREVQRAPGAPR